MCGSSQHWAQWHIGVLKRNLQESWKIRGLITYLAPNMGRGAGSAVECLTSSAALAFAILCLGKVSHVQLVHLTGFLCTISKLQQAGILNMHKSASIQTFCWAHESSEWYFDPKSPHHIFSQFPESHYLIITHLNANLFFNLDKLRTCWVFSSHDTCEISFRGHMEAALSVCLAICSALSHWVA